MCLGAHGCVLAHSTQLCLSALHSVASIHRASGKAHSRKPVFIHPHAFTVSGRRQVALISELPRRVLLGNSVRIKNGTSIKGELVTSKLIHKSHNQLKSIGSRRRRNAYA